jgi:hypothetical protein
VSGSFICTVQYLFILNYEKFCGVFTENKIIVVKLETMKKCFLILETFPKQNGMIIFDKKVWNKSCLRTSRGPSPGTGCLDRPAMN